MSEEYAPRRRLHPVITVVLLLLLVYGVWTVGMPDYAIGSATYDSESIVAGVDGTAQEPVVEFKEPIRSGGAATMNIIAPSGEFRSERALEPGETAQSFTVGGGLIPVETGTWRAVILNADGEEITTVVIEIVQKSRLPTF